MARINQDFDLFAAEDKQINFTILDENNQAVDLEGSEAVWVAVRLSAEPIIVMTKRVSTGGILIQDNTYQVLLNDIDTDQLHGKYRHELKMTNSEGKDSVVAVGQLQIYKSFTKDL